MFLQRLTHTLQRHLVVGRSGYVFPSRAAQAHVPIQGKVLGQGDFSLQRYFATQRTGITGPLSARKRLPMRGLEEFLEGEKIAAGDKPVTGRSWRVGELRKKSFEDLHKLWFVLYKEKNMLLTERLRARRNNAGLIAGERRQKVKRSMKSIRTVVGERQRVKQAALAERQRLKKLEQEQEEAKALSVAAADAKGSGRDGDVETTRQ